MTRPDRGQLKLTSETYEAMRPYMHTMKRKNDKTLYYAAIPVMGRNAKEDVWEQPDGKRIALCF